MTQIWHHIKLSSIVNLTVRRFASKSSPKEIRFSETAAYYGVDRRNFNLGKLTWKPDYYSSNHYKNSKLISALSSILAVMVWFGFLREPSDLDEILNAPPHLLSANLERRMLTDEIERRKRAGKNTALLEAELEYVEVKEAAMKVQFKK